MSDLPWLYRAPPWAAFIAVFASLFALSYLGYRLGARARGLLSESVPTTILGLLALILGFTFSMTISRFEHRRQLAIEEANAIGTAYLRSGLLRRTEGAALQDELIRYLDERIGLYSSVSEPETRLAIEERLERTRARVWRRVGLVVEKDRGAVESIFVSSVNQAFDLANERDISFRKTLPRLIYWAVVFISAMAMMTFSFVRGTRRERGQWQPATLILVIAFVFYLILDLERPEAGSIRISQEALTSLRAVLSRPAWRSSGAAGRSAP